MVKYANIFRYFLNYRFYVFIIVMICIIIIYITRSGKREGINSNECTTHIKGKKDAEGRTIIYFCDSLFNGDFKRIRPGSTGLTDYLKKKKAFRKVISTGNASIPGDCPPNWKKMNSYCAPPPSPSPLSK